MKYCKHLIECQCILPIFKNNTSPIFHKFTVFSLFDLNENIKEKWVKCNNCDAVHRVYDICKSEILKNSEKYTNLVTTLDDLKFALPSDIINILSKNNSEIADYEMSAYFIKEKVDQEKIILSKKEIENEGKILVKYISFENGKYEINQSSYQIGL